MKLFKTCLLVAVIVTIAGVTGCDYLGYDETSKYSKEQVFSDFGRTKQFLNNVYRHIPSGYNSVGGAMRASATDNAEEVNPLASVQKFNDGSWSAINTLDSEWGAMYDGIRATNKFLKEFDISNFEDRQFNNNYDQLVKQAELYPAQARFLRAFFHWKLIKRYGSVPLVNKVLEPDEVNTVKPSSFQEVTDFIVAEMDSITVAGMDTTMKRLPEDYGKIPGNETGRATRGAAMALKEKVLFYAASPLHNSEDGQDPVGDPQKWEKAAKAANNIINSAFYSLNSDYGNVVNSRNSSENIFERRRGNSNGFERSNFPVGYEGGKPGTAPTQNLVDAYEMQANGESIDESTSGYDSQNPYQGRDPRLKETIIVNNSEWKNRNVEIWEGGLDGLPQELATKTGYYLKKQVNEGINLTAGNVTKSPDSWTIFRYGGILLDYAEAMNEAYGPNSDPDGLGMTAREAVNKVRQRANMPDFPAGMGKSQFREKLRNERRVEMAFENQRFWDIRRWKIGPSTTDIKGMKITRNDDGTFIYKQKSVENRSWEDKMYFYPIPQSELFKNDALEQNPNW